jgi:hypothetical protein
MLLAGCQMVPADAETAATVSRDYDQRDKQALWDALLAALEQNDIPVIQADFAAGKIHARQVRYLNPEWARCSYGRVFDPMHVTNKFARAWPLFQGTDLRMAVTEEGEQARLTIRPAFFDRQMDSDFRTFPYQVPCRSTGVLEQALLDAPTP